MRAIASITTALFLVTSLGIVPAAYAQTSPQDVRAKELFGLGTKHFDASEYEKAEAAFFEAYTLSHRAGFLWNMAQCARLRGDKPRALKLYRQYLSESPKGSERAEASNWVKVLEAELAEVSPTAASVVPPVAAGSPQPSGPTSPVTTEATQGDQASNQTLPWVLGGIGLAGVTVGGVTGVMALGKQSTVQDECDGAACSAAGKDAADSGKTLAMVSNVGFGVGVAGLAAAVVMLVTRPKAEGVEQSRRWTPTVAYDGRGGWIGATASW